MPVGSVNYYKILREIEEQNNKKNKSAGTSEEKTSGVTSASQNEETKQALNSYNTKTQKPIDTTPKVNNISNTKTPKQENNANENNNAVPANGWDKLNAQAEAEEQNKIVKTDGSLNTDFLHKQSSQDIINRYKNTITESAEDEEALRKRIKQAQADANVLAIQNMKKRGDNPSLATQGELQRESQKAFQYQMGVVTNEYETKFRNEALTPSGNLSETAKEEWKKFSLNSSHFKKYKYAEDISDAEKAKILAKYKADKLIQGEQTAAYNIDNTYRNIVGEKMSGAEKIMSGVANVLPTIESALIQATGMAYGSIGQMLDWAGVIDFNESSTDQSNLNLWETFIDSTMDNTITRLADENLKAGASFIGNTISGALGGNSYEDTMKQWENTKTDINPNGLGQNAIIKTDAESDEWFNAANVGEALTSAGFTTASMLVGGAFARGAGLLFRGLGAGINAANKANIMFKSAEAVNKATAALRKVQNVTNALLVPSMVGGMEGLTEGLSTKQEAYADGMEAIDDAVKQLIIEETNKRYEDDTTNPMIATTNGDGQSTITRPKSRQAIFQEVLSEFASGKNKEYNEMLHQVEVNAAKAGVYNFEMNSFINGAANTLLKSAIFNNTTRDAIKNSKLLGWAYRKPRFNIIDGEVVPSGSKIGKAINGAFRISRELMGEGLEEGLQNISNDMAVAGANANIQSFIDNKLNGDGTATIGETFGEEWAAASAALGEDIKSKETYQAAFMGILGSVLGSPAGMSRAYIKDDKGNLSKSFSTLYQRGYKADGSKESYSDMVMRLAPWRSSVITGIREYREEQKALQEEAKFLQKWFDDPDNAKKFENAAGAFSYAAAMADAAITGDNFGYKNARIGMLVNDIMMLNRFKGAEFYKSAMQAISDLATLDENSSEGQKLIAQIKNGGDGMLAEKSDEEITKQAKDNALRMQKMITSIDAATSKVESLYGSVDADTKQALVHGEILVDDWKQRKKELEEKIAKYKAKIKNTATSNTEGLSDDILQLYIQYGNLKNAIKASEDAKQKVEALKEKKKALKSIDKNLLSDAQKQELNKIDSEIEKAQTGLEQFKPLMNKKGDINYALADITLNETDIMNLDAKTRAYMLARGAQKEYALTHKDEDHINTLNRALNQIEEEQQALEEQKERLLSKYKRHSKESKVGKKLEKINARLKELETSRNKNLKDLDALNGKGFSEFYSKKQQAIISGLIQQGSLENPDFLDDVVDAGRIESAINRHYMESTNMLMNPNYYADYVEGAKNKARLNSLKWQAHRISEIENYGEYSRALDALLGNSSQIEMLTIFNELKERSNEKKEPLLDRYLELEEQIDSLEKELNTQSTTENTENTKNSEDKENQDTQAVPIEEPTTIESKKATLSKLKAEKEDLEYQIVTQNFDSYINNQKALSETIKHLDKRTDLSNNDKGLIIYAIQYLQSKVISYRDREAAVEALSAEDENGFAGGDFRKYVETLNAAASEEDRRYLPIYTNVSDVLNKYVAYLNGVKKDEYNDTTANPVITTQTPIDSRSAAPTVPATPQETPLPTTGGVNTNIFQTEEALNAQTRGLLKSTVHRILANLNPALLEEIENTIVDNDGFKVHLDDIERALMAVQPKDDVEDKITALRKACETLSNSKNTRENYKNLYKAIIDTIDAFNDETSMGGEEGSTKGGTVGTPIPVNPEDTGKPKREVNPNSSTISGLPLSAVSAPWAKELADLYSSFLYSKEADAISAKNTPVFFITNDNWESQAREYYNENIEGGFDAVNHTPIVFAIPAPSGYKGNTLKVGDKNLIPIGILPAGDAKNSGASATRNIRQNALTHSSLEETTRLLTDSVGNPLTTHLQGAKWRIGNHPDANKQTKRVNNIDTNRPFKQIWENSGGKKRISLKSILQSFKIKDNQVVFVYNSGKVDAKGNAENNVESLVRIAKIEEIHSALKEFDNKTLQEVIEDIITSEASTYAKNFKSFNKTVEGIHDALFGKNDSINKADNVWGALSHAIYIADKNSKDIGEFEISRNSELGKLIYLTDGKLTIQKLDDDKVKVSLTYTQKLGNKDIKTVELGEYSTTQNDEVSQAKILANLLKVVQSEGALQLFHDGGKEENGEKRAAFESQMERLIEDDMLFIASDSLIYDFSSVAIRSPYNSEGQRVFDENGKPINNVVTPATRKERGTTENGGTIDPNSGIIVGGPQAPGVQLGSPKEVANHQKSEMEKQIDTMHKTSEEFKLSDDETCYERSVAGKIERFLRVTSIIGASEDTIDKNFNPIKIKLYINQGLLNDIYQSEEARKNIIDKINKLSKEQKAQYNYSEVKKLLDLSDEQLDAIRNVHKHNSFGDYATPSTVLGNTLDIITRDFFNGELDGKSFDYYKNIDEKTFNQLKLELRALKADLEQKGITVVSKNIMAFGTVDMLNKEGKTVKVPVAGTLDLFAYDKNGNVYIFDMKSMHDNGKGLDVNIAQRKEKWAKQVSLYAQLLKQQYPNLHFHNESLKIITLNSVYPDPKNGVQYTEEKKDNEELGQLKQNGVAFKMSTYDAFNDITDTVLNSTSLGTMVPIQAKGDLKLKLDKLAPEDRKIADGYTSIAASNSEEAKVDRELQGEKLNDVRLPKISDYDWNKLNQDDKDAINKEVMKIEGWEDGIQSQEDFIEFIENEDDSFIKNILKCGN